MIIIWQEGFSAEPLLFLLPFREAGPRWWRTIIGEISRQTIPPLNSKEQQKGSENGPRVLVCLLSGCNPTWPAEASRRV